MTANISGVTLDPLKRPQVALFITCLADVIRPSVGFAAVRLLEQAGCDVSVPLPQGCCGQPAYNAGDRDLAKDLALRTMETFSGFDYVVAPSASCAGMLKVHYPKLFVDDAHRQPAAEEFANRVHELISFLFNMRGMRSVLARHEGCVMYHDSCAALREIKMGDEARGLITSTGLTLMEMADREACCGFGGLFAVKYDDISDAIVTRKAASAAAAGAPILTGPDLGCLIHIAGKLSRQGSPIACWHIAEILASDMTDKPICGS